MPAELHRRTPTAPSGCRPRHMVSGYGRDFTPAAAVCLER
jgi:hypothetical protein